MAQPLGIEYMRRRLNDKRPRVDLRYSYYEAKNSLNYLGPVIPRELLVYKAVLGWSAKAADALADRLVFHTFEDDNFDLVGIYNMNNRDILFDNAVLSAAISSCCFIYISPDEDGFPRLQVIDGGNATGKLDPITGMLTEGYAVLRRDDMNHPELEAHFLPGSTVYYERGRQKPVVRTNIAPYPLLVPIIHRPDSRRPFGHSRISRACMTLQQQALRTLLRSEVSAEFYSFPQKYVTGLANDAEFEGFRAAISSFLSFTKGDDGEEPKLGQFTQQSMSPFTEQLRTIASLFAGETGLTLDDLGFATENPSSADAIKATHENLRLAARKAQRTFGSGFLNAGFLAACLRDNFAYRREQLYLTRPRWEPVFEPDAAMLGMIGDGAAKINRAVPGYFGKSNLRTMTGIEAES